MLDAASSISTVISIMSERNMAVSGKRCIHLGNECDASSTLFFNLKSLVQVRIALLHSRAMPVAITASHVTFRTSSQSDRSVGLQRLLSTACTSLELLIEKVGLFEGCVKEFEVRSFRVEACLVELVRFRDAQWRFWTTWSSTGGKKDVFSRGQSMDLRTDSEIERNSSPPHGSSNVLW